MKTIDAIELERSDYNYFDKNNNPIKRFEPISKINIFVGANNSGKSRFLRILAHQVNYKIHFNNILIDTAITGIISNLTAITRDVNIQRAFTETNNNLHNGNQFRETLRKSNFTSSYEALVTMFDDWITFANTLRKPDQQSAKEKLLSNSQNARAILNGFPFAETKLKPKFVYIPVLRGLRSLVEDFNYDDSSNYYSISTKRDYFPNFNNINLDLFTGLDFYNRLIEMLLGNNEKRKIISNYQDFLSEKLFENKSISLIPNKEKKAVVIKIGSEKEQPIHHLGDGIQSIIILTFLPYITDVPTFFFIEEPEQFLHPGMQRKIMDIFSSNEGNLDKQTFFLTTHSNHFLDLTIDYPEITIFNFQKRFPQNPEDEITPEFTIDSVDKGDISSLELLGVRNSSVFLVNATIWVEGITDRWYLREMLNQFMKSNKTDPDGDQLKIFEEDTHYSFVEYGGSNITHWSFLNSEDHPIVVNRLCSKAILILDNDGDDKKLGRKRELKEKLGRKCQILDAREIENTLSPNVIRHVVAEYEKMKDEKIEEVFEKMPEYTYDKYRDVPLGEFIEQKLIIGKRNRTGSYQEESGTISDKVAFCKKALPHIKYEELPDKTKELIELIYKHIKDQNI